MEKLNSEIKDWESSNIQVFWGEIAPCDHLLQIYQNDLTFLNTLEGFAGDGFMKGESVIILATQEHIDQLDARLTVHGFDLNELRERDQYITMEAEDCLSHFMVNNWPDENLFQIFISDILRRAQENNRKVRAFGELVALLWANGHTGATVHLEILWHRLHSKNNFCLYCAYPQSGFTQNANASIDKIRQTHTKVIDGNARPSTEIYYKTA